MDQLPWFGKRELICLLFFTCNYVVSVWRGLLFRWVLGMGYVILLWHSLSLPYNYFSFMYRSILVYTRLYFVLFFYPTLEFFDPTLEIPLPMGTNCAPCVADLFLFCYERAFMTTLSDDNQSDNYLTKPIDI